MNPQNGEIALNDIPTRGEVHRALSQIARRTLLGYDTRIVETGAVLRALQSPKHHSPGMPAIMDLHRAFIQAASMNPDPWLLKREQVAAVLQSKIPWLESENKAAIARKRGKKRSGWGGCGGKDSMDEHDMSSPAGDSHAALGNQGVIRRLISAYDPQGCGLVRFVRLSVSLMCCCNPGMANLVSMLTAAEEKRHAAKAAREQEERAWDVAQANATKFENTTPYLHTSTDTHSHVHDPGGVLGTKRYGHDEEASIESHTTASVSAYREQNGGEVYLLKLIHGLYEDCEGAHDPSNTTSTSPTNRPLGQAGMGIRLDHVSEALSCCCTSVEEELRIGALVDKYMVQSLFDKAMKSDDVTNDIFGQNADIDDEGSGSGSGSEGEDILFGDADDLSSNFTALSRFTPANAPVASFHTHGGVRSKSAYQPRWPEHSRGVLSTGISTSTSSVSSVAVRRNPHDRTSGAGVYSASAQAVTNFMNSSRTDTFEGQKFYTATAGGAHNTPHPSDSKHVNAKAHTHTHATRGGDSVAWADDASVGMHSVTHGRTQNSAGTGSRRKKHKHKQKKRLAAAQILKHRNIRSVLSLKRVSQDDFIDTLLSHSEVIHEFHKQLLRWRNVTTEYILHGSITFEDSVVDDASYGTRNNYSMA